MSIASDAKQVASGALAAGYGQNDALAMAQQCMMDQAAVQLLSTMEASVDAELERAENLTEDDLAKIRANRIEQMKKKAQQQASWQNMGHGSLGMITDQKEFFSATKNSEKVVALFNRESNRYGKIMQEHMRVLAARHMEARFIYIDAENAPFITDKLNIYMLPTIVCISGNKVKEQHNGLDEIDGSGKYSTGMLEYLLHLDGLLDEAPIYEQEVKDEEDELADLDLDD